MKMRTIWIVLGLIAALGIRPALANTFRVDDNSSATSPDGSAWDNTHCFKFLQDAIAAASSSGDVILVAGGTYHPDDGGAQTPGDRDTSFVLPGGVTIQGGYRGLAGGGNPNDHDPAVFITTSVVT